jgi:DegV family protein with EDD domain
MAATGELARRFKTYSTHPGVRIVLDSCSDVTTATAQRLGVDLLEFPYVMDGRDCVDDQYEEVSAERFYDAMRGGAKLLTSAVPRGQFLDIFEACAADGIPTLYLSFTAGLSRSVVDAMAAAEEVRRAHPGFELSVIDNCTPSLCAVLLAAEAARLRDEEASMSQVSAWCEANKTRVHGYFTLDSLDWLAAGGRIPKAAAALSSVLDMKANLTFDLDGSLTLTGVSRGRKKALRAIVKSFKEHYDPQGGSLLGIVDAGCPEDADALEELVRAELGAACPPIERAPLDPTVGSHTGPGMLGLAFWGTDRAGLDLLGKR